jgi:hypothetical protein
MRLSNGSVGSAGVVPVIVMAAALGGCSLEAAMATCASCGEVRSVQARVVRSEIHLPSPLDAYAPAEAVPASGQGIVFHVRVRMDRGGSRDFMLPRADFNVGDRVEIRGDTLVVRDGGRGATGMRWS